ncbi:MAG: class I SAM-dependent methyltransferase, partial [Pseudomonadales bacterium]|nr:class I SAM-dependent methyltransferase [Pseudomonadales bacterium]
MDRPATWDSTKERRGLWVSIARKLVFHQLSQLHTGCIELCEGDNVYHFGEVWVSGADLVAELHVKDPDCYLDILTGGSIGAAEAYMTGDWFTPDLTALVRVMVRNRDILDRMEGGLALLSRPFLTALSLLRRNTEKGARRNIAAHYDLGNDFFKRFLDPTMMYSSGIFPEKDASMEQASLHKLKTICERLQLKPGEHVIEIGTGWGGFALYAAKHYGVQVTTTTISQQQYNYAKAEIEAQGLQDQITLLSEDYRRLEGQYDKLVSIE